VVRVTAEEVVHVRVPATSANLGPGFDALGLALSLYDDLEVRVTASGLRIEIDGEGEALADAGEGHLVVQALRAGFAAFAADGQQPPGLALRCVNRIPHGRGLGSSAAAIVAGLLAAQALCSQALAAQAPGSQAPGSQALDAQAPGSQAPGSQAPGSPGPADLLALATRIEGHPDNVAACLAGGLTIAWTTSRGPRLTRLDPIPEINPVVCIAPPDIAVRTEIARNALPATVPHHEAAATAGRAALLVAALTQKEAADQLFDATEDWLHQAYRAAAMPDTYALVTALRAHDIPAVVSGAGPSVLAFITAKPSLDRLDSIVRETGKAWYTSSLDVARQGARVLHPGGGGPSGNPLPRDTDDCEGMP
jgi:homoserine kinase